MQVEIKALGGLELTDDLRAFCRERIEGPMRRVFDREGPMLEIELSDLYGPKGGVDKRCRVTYWMPRTKPITVSEVQDDIYKAIDGAARRFRRLVLRNKDWKLIRTRYPTKYFAAEQEHGMQPGEVWSPADITQEEDSLAAREERLRREEAEAQG